MRRIKRESFLNYEFHCSRLLLNRDRLNAAGSFRNEQAGAFRRRWKRLIDNGCANCYKAFKEEGGYGIKIQWLVLQRISIIEEVIKIIRGFDLCNSLMKFSKLQRQTLSKGVSHLILDN